MKFKIGDEVLLKIDDPVKLTQLVKVQIIGINPETDIHSEEYICYVPSYERISNSFKITDGHARYYEFHKKYVGEEAIMISDSSEIEKHFPSLDGEVCNKCTQFVEYAEKADGFFTCRSCKENPCWR